VNVPLGFVGGGFEVGRGSDLSVAGGLSNATAAMMSLAIPE
jgi:hypothetical protein